MQMHKCPIGGEQVVAFLQQLLRHIDGKLLLMIVSMRHLHNTT
jgi:hypothetical protein